MIFDPVQDFSSRGVANGTRVVEVLRQSLGRNGFRLLANVEMRER